MIRVFFFSALLFACSVESAQNPNLNRELAIKNENNEQEIRMIKERIETQESIIDSISEKVSTFLKSANSLQKSTKDKIHSQSKDLEQKFGALVEDLKKLKSQANDTAHSIEKMVSKFREQDDFNAKISHHLEKIEEATKSLAKAMQNSLVDCATQGDLYIVKSGDTLEKIAKNHKLTIKSLKEINNLENDTIFAGQKLKVTKE